MNTDVVALPSIVHSIPGRARLRVSSLAGDMQVAARLELYLRDQRGITDVWVNTGCGSVTIVHDPSLWSAETLHACISGLNADELAAYRPRRRPAVQDEDETEDSTPPLFFSSVGLAVGALAEPVAAPILPVLLLISAWPTLCRAYDAFVNHGKLTVDVLDASALTVLTVEGNLVMATFMVWLNNLSDFIYETTIDHSAVAIREALQYRRYQAWVVRDGRKVRVHIDQIRIGDVVVVYSGEHITVDGTVVAGKALVDQGAFTGEAVPSETGVQDPVYAGEVVRSGKLYIRTEEVGDHTEAAKVVRLLAEAPAHRTKMQTDAVAWADDLVPYSLAGAGTAALLGDGLSSAVEVLMVDYGTGIRMAAPTTVLSSISKAARSGVVIKGGRCLELMAEVDTVVFTLAGTLTSGRPMIQRVLPHGDANESDLLMLAAGAEQRLNHPLARAIVRAAEDRKLSIPDRTTSEYSLGLGVESEVDGQAVLVGNSRFMRNKGVRIPGSLQQELTRMEAQILSPLCVAVGGDVKGLLEIDDVLRPDTSGVLRSLEERGVHDFVLLTGHRQLMAERAAGQLGISRVFPEASPEEKEHVVRRLQAEGRTVAVIGHGITDANAIAAADVGIAMEAGAEVTRGLAHAVLLHGGLHPIPLAIDIGREMVDLLYVNWKIIAYPNTVALALACLGVLGPTGVAILSDGASLLATVNGLRPLIERADWMRLEQEPTARHSVALPAS